MREKTQRLLHTCAPISELPSNTSTMRWCVFVCVLYYQYEVSRREQAQLGWEHTLYKSTVCPKSLDPFYLVTSRIILVNTSWTYSISEVLRIR